MIAVDGSSEDDVDSRIAKAAVAVFQCMHKVWCKAAITTKMKIQLYNTIILLTALNVSETWKIIANIGQKLDAFHQ